MSQRTVFPVIRGATHRLTLASELGDTFTATCTASIRRLPGGRNSSSPDDTVAASYTVTTFAGSATYGPGFYLTLAATTTDDLEAGIYVADAKIVYTAPSTDTQVTDQWLLEVVQPATQPA